MGSDGVRIHYQTEGEGVTLLYRLVMLDARGHGGSDKPHEPAAYEPRRFVDLGAARRDVLMRDAEVAEMPGEVGAELAAVVGLHPLNCHRKPLSDLVDKRDRLRDRAVRVNPEDSVAGGFVDRSFRCLTSTWTDWPGTVNSGRFRRVLKLAGLAPFKLYDLRHTYASHLLGQRIKPVDVAKVMGHRSTTTTLTFYEHWIPRDMGYIADKLTAARQRH